MADTATMHADLIKRAQAMAERARGAGTDLNRQIGLDLIVEAECAWLDTGLMPESLDRRDMAQIADAIVTQTAAVLLLAGWTPPAEAVRDAE